MKLTLDQLRVDSYATQLSEAELTDVKGGTTLVCVDVGIAAVTAIAAVVTAVSAGANDHKECDTVTTVKKNADGSTTTTVRHICHE